MIETTKIAPWALASLSVSNMRAIPDHTSELVSQVMMGTPLKVLDYKEKFYQVQTPEGYRGWLDAKGLELFCDDGMESWKNSPRCFYNRIAGYVYSYPDTKSDIVSDLVLGDLFVIEEENKDFRKSKLPDGRGGYVIKDECLSFDEWISLPPDVDALITIAKKMMGFPYLWGGASSKATDCSGFTKLIFYSRGIILARDASQQVKYGQPVYISRLENLEKGDLLFFGNSAERPGHVGIHLGNGDFIHSSGRVHISSIIPGNPKHDPDRNFVAARRILNALDTEGITSVGKNVWYVAG